MICYRAYPVGCLSSLQSAISVKFFVKKANLLFPTFTAACSPAPAHHVRLSPEPGPACLNIFHSTASALHCTANPGDQQQPTQWTGTTRHHSAGSKRLISMVRGKPSCPVCFGAACG